MNHTYLITKMDDVQNRHILLSKCSYLCAWSWFKKKTRRLIYMGVGVFHEPLNFEHTYVTCKFVGVLVGFFCKAPILWVSPKHLAFRTFVVWKKIHFFPFIFEVITKLFMVVKKCELCPPLGAYVVACVCVILFLGVGILFFFFFVWFFLFLMWFPSCFNLHSSVHVDVEDPFMIPPYVLFFYGLLNKVQPSYNMPLLAIIWYSWNGISLVCVSSMTFIFNCTRFIDHLHSLIPKIHAIIVTSSFINILDGFIFLDFFLPFEWLKRKVRGIIHDLVVGSIHG